MPVPLIPDFVAGESAGVVAKLDQLSALHTFLLNPPSCVASFNAATNLGNAAWSSFSLTEITDTDTMHDDVTNPSRITFKTAGRYLVRAYVAFNTNATGARGCMVRLNSAGSFTGGTQMAQSIIAAQAAGGSLPFVIFEYVFNVNDYVEMFGYQSSGAALAMVVGYPYTYLAARFTAVS